MHRRKNHGTCLRFLQVIQETVLGKKSKGQSVSTLKRADLLHPGIRITGNLATPIAGTLMKIVVNPLLGLALALFLHMSPDEIRVALLLLACPTAITAYVMTQQLGGYAPLSAAIIVLTSALAAIPYAIILFYVA